MKRTEDVGFIRKFGVLVLDISFYSGINFLLSRSCLHFMNLNILSVLDECRYEKKDLQSACSRQEIILEKHL